MRSGSRSRTHRSRWVITGLAMILMAAGCGSALSREELAASNGTVSSADASAGTDTGGGQQSDEVATEETGVTSGPHYQPGGDATPGSSGPAQQGAGSSDGAVAPLSRSEIILGSIGVAGGPIGATVASAPVGARAWVASINSRGGLNGHPVRLIVQDDGGDASRAASLVRKMVEQQGVVAFYGTYAPTTLQAITPYLEQKGVPIIGGVSGNAVEETSPMVFNPQAGPSIVPPASVASIGAQLPADKRNVAIFYCIESAQCSIIRDGMRQRASEFGVTISYEAQISLAQPDFTSQLAQARNAGANVLFVAADLNSLLRLARGADRQGYDAVLAGAFQYDLDEVKTYKSELDGLIGFSLTPNYDASELLKDYRQAVERFVPGGQVGGLGAQAWTQGKLLEAVAPALGDNVTSSDLTNALLGLRGDTLGGLSPPLTFRSGPHRDVNHCYIPTRFVDGHWTEPLGEEFRCLDY